MDDNPIKTLWDNDRAMREIEFLRQQCEELQTDLNRVSDELELPEGIGPAPGEIKRILSDLRQQLELKHQECISFYNEAETVIKQRDDLRQQLSEVQNELDVVKPYAEECSRWIGTFDNLRQQLTTALAACKVKDEALDYVDSENASEEVLRRCSLALAATADLKDVRLCHAEPITLGSGVTLNTTKGYIYCGVGDSFYRAWEPK